MVVLNVHYQGQIGIRAPVNPKVSGSQAPGEGDFYTGSCQGCDGTERWGGGGSSINDQLLDMTDPVLTKS